MTDPTPLSPAAQAVMDAFDAAALAYPNFHVEPMIAAALRAAADQVVPEYETTPWGTKIGPTEPVCSIRVSLLAIAAELDGTQPSSENV